MKRPVATTPVVGATIAPAREAAFAIILRVDRGDDHSDELLRRAAVNGLSRADRDLCTALVMGVLRWQIAIDAVIRPLLARPDQRLAVEVQVALRLGVFQLRYMDRIPAHAALNESVELCRAAGQPHAAGMVNAVLRKVAGTGQEAGARGRPLWEATAAFAERLGHPLWLVERWVESYGRPRAMAICEAGQREPGRGELFGGETAALSADAAVGENVGSGERGVGAAWDPEDAEVLPEAGGRGDLLGMDDGSRLVAELAAAAMPNAARVWDCCAAPGGKTAVLLDRLSGAKVLASDVSARRLDQMKLRLARLVPKADRLRTRVVAAEALPEHEGSFDLVLCDVPCTGTGTLARNPEIRHRLRADDLARQAERQRGILAAALTRVAPGGRLVYATCSLEPEECEAVVSAVAGGWRQVPIAALLEQVERGAGLRVSGDRASMTAGDALRTLPGVHPCDGFYAVVLERASA